MLTLRNDYTLLIRNHADSQEWLHALNQEPCWLSMLWQLCGETEGKWMSRGEWTGTFSPFALAISMQETGIPNISPQTTSKETGSPLTDISKMLLFPGKMSTDLHSVQFKTDEKHHMPVWPVILCMKDPSDVTVQSGFRKLDCPF